MQPELAVDEIELGRRDQAAMRDPHAIERAVEIGRPEIEEVDELGKARRKIVVLPDIALQQPLMVWKAVEDLGGRQRKALDLAKEGRVGMAIPARLVLAPT